MRQLWSIMPFFAATVVLVVLPISLVLTFADGTEKGLWTRDELIVLKVVFGTPLDINPHRYTSLAALSMLPWEPKCRRLGDFTSFMGYFVQSVRESMPRTG